MLVLTLIVFKMIFCFSFYCTGSFYNV